MLAGEGPPWPARQKRWLPASRGQPSHSAQAGSPRTALIEKAQPAAPVLLIQCRRLRAQCPVVTKQDQGCRGGQDRLCAPVRAWERSRIKPLAMALLAPAPLPTRTVPARVTPAQPWHRSCTPHREQRNQPLADPAAPLPPPCPAPGWEEPTGMAAPRLHGSAGCSWREGQGLPSAQPPGAWGGRCRAVPRAGSMLTPARPSPGAGGCLANPAGCCSRGQRTLKRAQA